jgi:hypothetical protein
MKNLAEKLKDKKQHLIISSYARQLANDERKKTIIEISETHLLLAANITIKCAKDEDLVTFLVEKAQKAGENEKLQKKVNVEAILSLLVFRKYVLATDLIFIEDKDTEDFKNENLEYLKELENETINADVIAICIGLAPTYDIALQFYNASIMLGVQSHIGCFCNLISKSFNYQAALYWYEQIQKENLTPTVPVYSNLMSISPNYETVLQWYEQIEKENLTPIIEVYGHLIHESPNYQTALQWYKKLKKENLTPNIRVYNSLIGKSSDYQIALQYYKQIQKESLFPTLNTYHNMIGNIYYLKDAKQSNEVAKRYYNKALKDNLQFTVIDTYKFMIYFSLSYSEAHQYFLAMEKAGFKADRDVWGLLSEKAISGADKKKLEALMKERNYVAVPTLSKEMKESLRI